LVSDWSSDVCSSDL